MRHQDVVGTRDTRAKRFEVPLAGQMQHRGTGLRPRIHRELVQRPGAGETPSTITTGPSAGKPKWRASSLLPGTCAVGMGRPTTRYFGPFRPSIGYARKTPVRERLGKAVRQTDVRVSFGEGGESDGAARQHHRAPTYPPGPENDVRPSPAEDPQCGEGPRGADERAELAQPRPARQARDREGVQLVARLRNQLRLDAPGRPGERHVRSARSQRVGDGERRPHVSGCPAGCDQAHGWRRLAH